MKRMNKRACPNCEHDVSNPDMNSPFLCDGCLEMITITNDDSLHAVNWSDFDMKDTKKATTKNKNSINNCKGEYLGSEHHIIKNKKPRSDRFESNKKLPKKIASSSSKIDNTKINNQEKGIFDLTNGTDLKRDDQNIGSRSRSLSSISKTKSATTSKSLKKDKVSRATVVGLVVGLVGALCLIFVFIIATKKLFFGAPKDKVKIQEATTEVTDTEGLGLYLSLADHEKAKEFLKEFFDCTSLTEAKGFVLPDKKINSALVRYWKPRSFENIVFIEGEQKVLPKNEGTVHFFNCKNAGGSIYNYPVYYLKKENRRFIGWRMAEQIEDRLVSDIIPNKLSGRNKVRCLLIKEDYHNSGYNSKDWLSFNCYNTSDSSQNHSYVKAYLKRGSKITKEIAEAFRNQSGFNILDERNSSLNFYGGFPSLAPMTIQELRKEESASRRKPYARFALELDVIDAEKGVAEIVDCICSTTNEYFIKYQLPWLRKKN